LGVDTSNQNDVEDQKRRCKPEDLATIILYFRDNRKTKGVMLYTKYIVSNVLDSA
jgi:hypothetical protein